MESNHSDLPEFKCGDKVLCISNTTNIIYYNNPIIGHIYTVQQAHKNAQNERWFIIQMNGIDEFTNQRNCNCVTYQCDDFINLNNVDLTQLEKFIYGI